MRISPLVLAFLLLGLPLFALAQPEGAEASEPESEVEGKQPVGASADSEDSAEEPAPVREFKPSEEIMADTELTLPADI